MLLVSAISYSFVALTANYGAEYATVRRGPDRPLPAKRWEFAMTIPRFTAEASVHCRPRAYRLERARVSNDGEGRVSPAFKAWWQLGDRCQFVCIEVCTRFCHPTGWDCCQWETRCALSCVGAPFLTIGS